MTISAMPQKLLSLYFFIFCFSTISHAQVLNIEKERLDQDTLIPLKIKIGTTINFYNQTAGIENPIEGTRISIDVNTIYTIGKHAYLFIAELNYGRVNKKTLFNYGHGHFRVNWLAKRKFSYESFMQMSYNSTRGMNLRSLVGSGIRWKIYNNEKIELNTGSGIMYEDEIWQHPSDDDITEFTYTFKSTSYFNLRYRFNEMLETNSTVYYQTGLHDNLLRNRLSCMLILNAKISKKLSFTNKFIMDYDDKPVVPISRITYTFKSGVSINL
ncbi:MAG: DUF481 domain-containing protein [Weeksellaceae bacterium]